MDTLASVVKGIHPKKEIRRAIKLLEAAGWTVASSKGRSSHAWGRAHCPYGHRECSVSIWGTPVDPHEHAASLLARITSCQRRSQAP